MAIAPASIAAKDYRVRLRSITSRDSIVFEVSPDIQESQTVEYKATNLLHTPGAIMTYGYTNSREFAISNARLISRTSGEAFNNMRNLQLLRSWTKPYFGSQSATSNILGANQEKLGAPPEILFLYAYARELDEGKGTYFHNRLTNIQHVPVVLTNLSFTYPSDVDYIPTSDTNLANNPNAIGDTSGGSSEPFPTIMSVNMTLVEVHSPAEYSSFSLQLYKAGILTDF